jgi:hypothetical protein
LNSGLFTRRLIPFLLIFPSPYFIFPAYHFVYLSGGSPVRLRVQEGNLHRFAVRLRIGYHRFDTEAEHAAFAEVYRCTNPLTNFWNPSVIGIYAALSPSKNSSAGATRKSTANQRPQYNAYWKTQPFLTASKTGGELTWLKLIRFP